MKNTYLFALLMVACASLFAQTDSCSGIVLDQANGQPIPLTSVRLVGREAGTYAGNDGRFSLTNLLATDTLVFSTLGYQTLQLPVSGLADTIYLSAVSYKLPTVDFTTAGEREHVVSLGFRKQRIRNGLIPVPGNQFARYVANPYGEEGLLVAATFQFSRGIPGRHSGGLFRVRVMARKPGVNTLQTGNDLLVETVEFTVLRKGGFISVPIREYAIAFPPEGLFIGLEYLAPAGKMPIREDGVMPGPSLGLYTTTKGRALTFSRSRDQVWRTGHLPTWREGEVPNMGFGAVVVFRR